MKASGRSPKAPLCFRRGSVHTAVILIPIIRKSLSGILSVLHCSSCSDCSFIQHTSVCPFSCILHKTLPYHVITMSRKNQRAQKSKAIRAKAQEKRHAEKALKDMETTQDDNSRVPEKDKMVQEGKEKTFQEEKEKIATEEKEKTFQEEKDKTVQEGKEKTAKEDKVKTVTKTEAAVTKTETAVTKTEAKVTKIEVAVTKTAVTKTESVVKETEAVVLSEAEVMTSLSQEVVARMQAVQKSKHFSPFLHRLIGDLACTLSPDYLRDLGTSLDSMYWEKKVKRKEEKKERKRQNQLSKPVLINDSAAYDHHRHDIDYYGEEEDYYEF